METLQEKIISLELTKPDELNLDVNGGNLRKDSVECEDEESVSEPPTPTSDGREIVGGDNVQTKKKKRKRSKKGKH